MNYVADNDDIRRVTALHWLPIISVTWQSRLAENVDKEYKTGRSPGCENDSTYPGSFYPL